MKIALEWISITTIYDQLPKNAFENSKGNSIYKKGDDQVQASYAFENLEYMIILNSIGKLHLPFQNGISIKFLGSGLDMFVVYCFLVAFFGNMTIFLCYLYASLPFDF